MQRVALKFSYDGSAFEGYARQPSGRTVEGDIIKALTDIKAVENASDNRFGSASRTDRGVSATGNVVAFDTDFDPKRLVQALNSKLEGAVVHSMAIVPKDFNPRHARRRHYRYFLPVTEVRDGELFRVAMALFEGEHDFASFSKKDGNGADTILALDSIEVAHQGDMMIVDIRAGRFLWQMIRRVVTAAIAAANGDIVLGDIEDALSGHESHLGLKPAAPQWLVLMDVEYDFEFLKTGAGPEEFERASREATVRSRVLALLAESVKTS